jgi:hypothetical protein
LECTAGGNTFLGRNRADAGSVRQAAGAFWEADDISTIGTFAVMDASDDLAGFKIKVYATARVLDAACTYAVAAGGGSARCAAALKLAAP